MKFPAISLALSVALSVVLADPALAAPGDPRLIQGTLEWPPTLSGGEPFIVLRGDDGRVYFADVMAAQRHVPGALSAANRITLLGLEGSKPHEIIGVALGTGDAAALSFALSQAPGTHTVASPTPSTAPAPPSPPTSATASAVIPLAPATAPAAVPPARAPLTAPPAPPTASAVIPPAPAATPAAVPPPRADGGRPARGQDGRWVTLRGSVHAVVGPTLFLKKDDGQVVVVDISRLDPGTGSRFGVGSPLTVVVVPVGNKFQATGFIEAETASGSTPAKPTR